MLIQTSDDTHGLIQGDVLKIVSGMPSESFTACFCDPPYGTKFMGKEWDHGVPGKEVWAEILRVLKPGAVLMAFGGTRTWHRLAVAIEDAGFEIFDTMMWLYGSGFPKSHNIGKAIDKAAGAEREVVGKHPNPLTKSDTGCYQWNTGGEGRTEAVITAPTTDVAKTWDGYGTALKPAWEPILLARKPRRATYAQTAMEHGTACLNIDGCRVHGKDVATERKRHGGGIVGNATSYELPDSKNIQPPGRWPANLLLSHSDCERVGVKKVKGQGMKRGTARSGFVGDATVFAGKLSEHRSDGHVDSDGTETVEAWRCAEGCPVSALGLSARFFQTFKGERFYYCAKASRKERDMGLEGMAAQHHHVTQRTQVYQCQCGNKSLGDNWPQCPKCGADMRKGNLVDRKGLRARNNHPTVKPLALCEYLARLIVPPEEYRDEAKLLVPFCGSGSEIIGALMAGWRNVTGIDIVPEYLEIARLRIKAYANSNSR